MPLTRPVIASFTVIAFLGAFNQYLWPRAVITDTDDWAHDPDRPARPHQPHRDESNVPVAGALSSPPSRSSSLLVLFQRHIVRGPHRRAR